MACRLFEVADQGVGAQGHAEPAHQAPAGTASQGVTDRADDLAESLGLLGVGGANFREPFGEDAPLTIRVSTPPAAQVQPEAYRRALDRQVSQAAPVAAVARAGNH